jgi:predicted transcriptional regulator
MTRRQLHELGSLQREVVEALWRLEEATVHDLLEALGTEHAYTTVLSVLQKLEKAGWIGHRREGRTYVWHASRSREEEGKSSLGKIVDRVFGGNPRVAFEHLLEDDRLDADDLAALRRLVEEKRKEMGS